MNFTYEKNEIGKHLGKFLQIFSSANEFSNFVTTAVNMAKSQLFTYVRATYVEAAEDHERYVILSQTAWIMTPYAETSYLQLLISAS